MLPTLRAAGLWWRFRRTGLSPHETKAANMSPHFASETPYPAHAEGY